MNNPYTFQEINAYNSIVSPSTVHVKNTGLAQFFKRYLLQEAMAPFEFTLPDHWARNYFLYILYVIGNIGVIETDQYGVIPQHGTPSGFNVFYQPFRYLIYNPLLKTNNDGYIIGEECSVIKLEPDWCGLYDIVDYYGDLMALTAETAGVNVLNSKLSYIFGASNKAQAETLKKLYDNIASGEPAQFTDKSLFDDEGRLMVTMFEQNVGQNYIADRLLETLRTLREMFMSDIGIPNANTRKRERMSLDEVNVNNFETRSKCSIWLDSLRKGFEETRDMFGLSEEELAVDWREELKDKEEMRINGYTVNSGNV